MLSRPVLFAVLALGLLATSFAEEAAAEAEEEPAFAQVVFYKGLILDGNYMVVSRNFSVKYSLYNVGTKNVENVHFADQWPEEYFDFVSGVAENTWAELAPGQNVSTTIVLVPKSTGKFTTAPAQFSYSVDGERKEGISSSFGEVSVVTVEDYERDTATYVKEWLMFVVLAVLPVFAPFSVWNQHKKARTAALGEVAKKAK